MTIMWWLAVLAGLVVLRPLLIWVVAHVFARAVGRKALSKQPDTIHLSARNSFAWAHAEQASALARPLLDSGFEDGGTYAVDELPGVVLQLMTHRGDGLMACVYEHPRAGHWIELVTRYADGRSCSFTTTPPTGLDPRPDHAVFHLPGTAPSELLAKALAERPHGAIVTIPPSGAAERFQRSWAESIAWRKAHGIAAREVAQVAVRRKIAA